MFFIDHQIYYFQGPNPWVSGHTKQSPMDPNMIWASNSYLVVFQVEIIYTLQFLKILKNDFLYIGPCCWYEDTDSHWGTFWREPCRGWRWIWTSSQWVQLEVAMSAFTCKLGFFSFSFSTINQQLSDYHIQKRHNWIISKEISFVFFAFRIWNLHKNFLLC